MGIALSKLSPCWYYLGNFSKFQTKITSKRARDNLSVHNGEKIQALKKQGEFVAFKRQRANRIRCRKKLNWIGHEGWQLAITVGTGTVLTSSPRYGGREARRQSSAEHNGGSWTKCFGLHEMNRKSLSYGWKKIKFLQKNQGFGSALI